MYFLQQVRMVIAISFYTISLKFTTIFSFAGKQAKNLPGKTAFPGSIILTNYGSKASLV